MKTKSSLPYLIPFLVYALTGPIAELLKLDFYSAYALRALITFAAIVYFWNQYKLKFKLDTLSIGIGVTAIIFWIALEGFLISAGKITYNPLAGGELAVLLIAIKIFSMVLVAPVVEELFTRSFLARLLINPNNWSSVVVGKYSHLSFIATVLFFGFMHERWIQGIIAGIFYSLLLYKTKKIESCIIAHAVSNLVLALIVIINQNWILW
jgi:CAAX prenyl protease-like protein